MIFGYIDIRLFIRSCNYRGVFKIDYNYHTHTFRCRHASGTPEEYIKQAIQNGVKRMGFSEHIPVIFPGGIESGFRVPMAEIADYFAELSHLKEKYKTKIDIKIGFEMEYYPTYFKTMLNTAVEAGAEYLILGQHFVSDEHPGGIPSGWPTERAEDLKEYVHCVIQGIESGVFTYVAHPEVLNFVGDHEIYDTQMRKLCVSAKKHNVPLEINFLGIRENRRYPNETFWQIAGEENSPVTFGFDAHDVKSAFDGQSLVKAKELVEKYKLNYIGEPALVRLQNNKLNT